MVEAEGLYGGRALVIIESGLCEAPLYIECVGGVPMFEIVKSCEQCDGVVLRHTRGAGRFAV